MIALNKLRDSKFEKKLPKPRINSLKRAFVYCGAMAWNTMYTSNSCYRLEDTNLLWWEHGIHLRIMFQLKDTKFFQCLLKQQPQFSAWSVFYYYYRVVPENIQTPTTEGISLEGTWRETKFNLLFSDRLMRRDARWPYKCLVKSTPFQREFNQEHATRSTTKLRENEKENKNSSF